ncbi:MAG: sigma-70 family RNA polymerase sigma factor [Acidimicrobiia bacterium]|nr:sigma-70 family RNA polymerase sigma factor [Acidimicrobiia bacterium]
MSEADRELIAQVAKGDRAAFTELMRRHESMVFAVCMRMLADRDRALDASQEVFLTLFRKAGKFRGESAVSTWLYRIAVNTSLDSIRKAKRRPVSTLPEGFEAADPTALDGYSAIEVRPEIEKAIHSLPPEFRAAVVLSDAHGLALAEISEILGVPVGTVKSRVFRARRLLAEQLGNLAGGSRHPTVETP